LKALEIGAEGILVPRLKTKEDVIKAMEAVKYSPEGVRGFCPYVRSHEFMPKNWTKYLDKADSETMFIPLIEEKEAVDNIEEIALVEGIDWMWFGCGDLCMSMGLRGDMQHPLVMEAREKVLVACQRQNIPVAEIGWNVEQAKKSIEDGFRVVMYTPDTNIIYKAMRRIVEDVKNLPQREMP
jgi:2-keto-3-deoxy-L-rhamnonate aldolase RhmA